MGSKRHHVGVDFAAADLHRVGQFEHVDTAISDFPRDGGITKRFHGS